MLCVPILYMLMLVAFFCLLSMNNVNKIKLLFVCMYSLPIHFQFSALNILNRYRVFGIKFSTSFRKCIYPYKRILSECFFFFFYWHCNLMFALCVFLNLCLELTTMYSSIVVLNSETVCPFSIFSKMLLWLEIVCF